MIDRYCDETNTGENYVTAVRYDGLIFVSGQLGVTLQGTPEPFDTQLRVALTKLIAAVERLGGDRTTLLKVNGYLADVDDFEVYHRVYREMLGDAPRPARTTVQVGRFDAPVLVEVDAVAAVLQPDGG